MFWGISVRPQLQPCGIPFSKCCKPVATSDKHNDDDDDDDDDDYGEDDDAYAMY